MRRLRVAGVIAAAAMSLVLTGCGGGNGTPAAGGGPTTQSTNAKLSLDDKANGTTVHVQLGDIITVTLHSTYWSFQPTDGLALQPYGPPATAVGSACPRTMGTGCGTVTASYNVGHVGTATLKAHRDSCGEALRCVGTSADWSVTVVAS